MKLMMRGVVVRRRTVSALHPRIATNVADRAQLPVHKTHPAHDQKANKDRHSAGIVLRFEQGEVI